MLPFSYFFQVFHNGVQVYEISDLVIRVNDTVPIDGIVFSTFFGGSTEIYASTQDCYTYYKNFVLSTNSDIPMIV